MIGGQRLLLVDIQRGAGDFVGIQCGDQIVQPNAPTVVIQQAPVLVQPAPYYVQPTPYVVLPAPPAPQP